MPREMEEKHPRPLSAQPQDSTDALLASTTALRFSFFVFLFYFIFSDSHSQLPSTNTWHPFSIPNHISILKPESVV